MVKDDDHPVTISPVDSAAVDTRTESLEVIELLRLVNTLASRNEQLAGQVGFLQAKVQEQDRQIALLMAPKDEPAEVTPAEPEPKRSWWRRLLGER
jgi:hypothetical protein